MGTSKRTQKAISIALKDVMIKFDTTKMEMVAIIFSALVSTFGIYQIVVSRMTGENVIYTMVGLVIILAVLDQVKRRGLISYYNDILKDKILGRKQNYKFAKITIFLTFSLLLLLDIVGSWSTSNTIAQAYKNSQIEQSSDFMFDNRKKKENEVNAGAYASELATLVKC